MGRTKEATLTLLAKVDQQIIDRSIKRLRDAREAVEDLEAAEKGLTRTGEALDTNLGSIGGELGQQVANLRQHTAALQLDLMAQERMSEALRDEADAHEEAAESAERHAIALEDIQDSSARNRFLKGMAPGGEALPEVPGQRRGIQRGVISGALSAAGSILPGEAGGVVRDIGGAARLIEQLPRLSDEMRNFAKETDLVYSSIGQAVPALSGLNTGIGALAAGGIAAVAIAALAIAIGQFVQQVQGYQDALDSAFEAQIKYNELIQTGTQEEIEAELQRIEVRQTAIEQTLAEADAARDAAEAMGGFQGALADLLNFLGVTTTEAERNARKELEQLQFEQNTYQNALQNEAVQKRHSADATEEAAGALQQQADSTQQANQQTQQASTLTQQYAGAISQASSAIQQSIERHEAAREAAVEFGLERRRINQEYADKQRELDERRVEISLQAEERRSAILEDALQETDRAARRLTFDLARLRAESDFREAEMAMDRDFAGIARSRRQTEFDLAMRQQESAFDARERSLALEIRFAEAGRQVEQQILDIRREGMRLEVERQKTLLEAQREAFGVAARQQWGGEGGVGRDAIQREVSRQMSTTLRRFGR